MMHACMRERCSPLNRGNDTEAPAATEAGVFLLILGNFVSVAGELLQPVVYCRIAAVDYTVVCLL